HQGDVRAERGGLLEEGQLVGGELLGGVGHHQQGVGFGQHGQRGGGQGGGGGADSRGVHQGQAVLQDRPGQSDFAAHDRRPLATAWSRCSRIRSTGTGTRSSAGG